MTSKGASVVFRRPVRRTFSLDIYTGQLVGRAGGATAGGGAGTLEHREPAALEPRRGVPVGPIQDPEGPRTPELRHAATDYEQPAGTGDQPEVGHTRQTSAGWLALRLPAQVPAQLRRDCPGKLKQWRIVPTRYDRKRLYFLSAPHLFAWVIWVY